MKRLERKLAPTDFTKRGLMLIVLTLLFLALSLTLPGFEARVQAEEAVEEEMQEETEEAEEAGESLQIDAGGLTYEEDYIDLEDGVVIYWQEYDIYSQRGEVDREDSITYLYEDISMEFDQGEINSQEMVIYLEDDQVFFQDDVILDITGEDNGEGYILETEELEYDTASDDFFIESDLAIEDENRDIAAGSGDYSAEEDVFYLYDGVEIVEAGGDTITSQQAELHLGEGDLFTAEGEVEIELEL